MRTVAIIPIKSKSTRVPKKNFRIFNGVPLYKHFLKKFVPNHPFDEIYVDTDSQEVKDCARRLGFSVIDRPKHLAADTVNGNHLLLYEANLIKADIYFQLFITAPLLSLDTIKKAHQIMTKNLEYDSILTALERHSWFWYKGKPINYDPRILPRSQDAEPIIQETTGLYGIRKEVLFERRSRIGYKPYFLIVNEREGIDLDNEIDFKIAEFLISLNKKSNEPNKIKS